MTQLHTYPHIIVIWPGIFVGVFLSHFQYSTMFPAGLKCSIVGIDSNQTMINGRDHAHGRISQRLSVSNENCLQDDLIRELHKAGIYEYAQNLGIIQNGIITVPNGRDSDENCNSELWPGTKEYSWHAFNGIPTRHSQFNIFPSVPLVSVDNDSIGTSSREGDVVMATHTSKNAMVKLNHPEGDEFEYPGTPVARRKRRRIHRLTFGEQGGRGLRHFSLKVCKKVESKGWTTYNEVASELVAEFMNPNSTLVSQDQQQYDEKNIRRRVYDALNVLMAMDIITKDKKEIQWKGLPTAHLNDIEQLKTERKQIITRLDQKRAYLQELEEQITGLQNLVLRNERVSKSGNHPSGGVALPFILVKTHPHATVDIEISEDMQLVHFDFNSIFELYDDACMLKAMQFCETPFTDGSVVERAVSGSKFNKLHSPLSSLYNNILPSRSKKTDDADSYSLSSIPGEVCVSSSVLGISKPS